MTLQEMLEKFSEMEIPESAFWLGKPELAEMKSGMYYDSGRWIVYFREKGQFTNHVEFSTQGEACDELYCRLKRLYHRN